MYLCACLHILYIPGAGAKVPTQNESTAGEKLPNKEIM